MMIMKKQLLTALLFSLVIIMASSELMANDFSISTDMMNWTPHANATMSLVEFTRPANGRSLNPTAPAIYLSLDVDQPNSTVSPRPNLNLLEPGTMLLLGIGMIGLASLGRRRFKK